MRFFFNAISYTLVVIEPPGDSDYIIDLVLEIEASAHIVCSALDFMLHTVAKLTTI